VIRFRFQFRSRSRLGWLSVGTLWVGNTYFCWSDEWVGRWIRLVFCLFVDMLLFLGIVRVWFTTVSHVLY